MCSPDMDLKEVLSWKRRRRKRRRRPREKCFLPCSSSHTVLLLSAAAVVAVIAVVAPVAVGGVSVPRVVTGSVFRGSRPVQAANSSGSPFKAPKTTGW